VLLQPPKAMDTHGTVYRRYCLLWYAGYPQRTGKKIAEFLGTEDTILYAAAFDANGGVFEPLFDAQDAIISDELNHASIIDGVRLWQGPAPALQA